MKKEFRSIFVVILIFVFALTGCKKTSEELAKEEDIKKRKLVSSSVNSVYRTFVNNLVFLFGEDAQVLKKKPACFDFRPKEGKASVKFYQHPEIYNLEVKTKNELEYVLTYKGKQADLKLTLKGELPKENSSVSEVLSAEMNIAIPGVELRSGFVNEVDLVYEYLGDRSKDSLHARFSTTEECEEDITRNEEIGKQKSTCEGPGC
ncbi:lipoprotein, tandem type [Leptospira interrogans]|uniref:Lipoprotein, tandem type n=8 Tax=Leptospira interrogans TaxID=173 RepID=A0AAW4K6C4_LEPIR|nr:MULTISPECIES: lipoprotein, tandem type [Leptospira]APH40485.1 Putative lipoprotein [Leptospira interrogans serovar Copenhageni/Icterohaemorrhagiae]EMG12406.1 putative lipoprotein [Leptospira interrogans serovar Grippotyphosa str. LT2186]EMN29549.1 putative lipoprotein [Leptospira interrogans serovar Pyrogenes str. L0374]EMO06703.1 putative lipoprotein [Leptospira interrogans serovar Icterohaemorrhagiae str. Verdun HP]EMP08988.1 putative lipoprotein [Leptospira interrogans serovar Pyrogenes 